MISGAEYVRRRKASLTSSTSPGAKDYDSTAGLTRGKVRKLPQPAIENPFRQVIEWTWYLRLKVLLQFTIILPIKFVLLVVSLFLLWLGALIASYGWRPDRPLLEEWQRRMIRVLLKRISRVSMFALGYHWVHVNGKRATEQEAPILVVAPHSSFVDVFVVGTFLFATTVAKDDSVDTPIMGTMVKLTEPILVRRSLKGAEAGQSVVEKVQQRINMPGRQNQVLFFPEGTTTSGQSLITFKTGAFQLGHPVQPVLLKYSSAIQSWTFIGPGGILSLLLTLSSPHNGLTVDFLPVYRPSEAEIADPKLYADNVQKLMAAMLGIGRTYHTYDDARLMMKAIELGLPEGTGLLEYATAKEMTGLGFADFQDLLQRFAHLDRDKDGFITAIDMQADLSWPVEEDVDEMFSEYDTSNNGMIDFREFVMGYADLCKDLIRLSDFSSMAFKVLSSHGGVVSWETAERMFAGCEVSDRAVASFQATLACLKSAGDFQDLFLRQPELSYLLHNRTQSLRK